MPALLVDTNARPASSSNASPTSERSRRLSECASPNRPPVSPITPRASVAQLAPVERTHDARPAPPPASVFRPHPAPVAIAESDNPDVIALRSAISLLQLQREKSRRDLKALAELKTIAVADPHAFVHALQHPRAHGDVLTPTLAGLAHPVPSHDAAVATAQAAAVDARKDSADVAASPTAAAAAAAAAATFPPIPQPQNIVRCPPINWEKYHIVGEPLDKIHQEQTKWPGQSEPPRTQSGARAPPHTVTAPYSPFTDAVRTKPTPAQPTSKSSKKAPTHGQ